MALSIDYGSHLLDLRLIQLLRQRHSLGQGLDKVLVQGAILIERQNPSWKPFWMALIVIDAVTYLKIA